MKKKYLTYAGIISTIILVAMFIIVFIIQFPGISLIPVVTIDPVTDQNLDDNNYLILTGKTNLPDQSHIILDIFPFYGIVSGGNETEKEVTRGDVWLTGGTGEWDLWKGTVNTSSLEPGEYQVMFRTIEFTNNYTEMIESDPVASFQFTLEGENCTGQCIRKKHVEKEPFIRINPISEEIGEMKVTGITSLAPGTPLVWKMDEKIGNTVTSPAGYQGKVKVIPGTEGVNRWSFMPDTDTIRPGLFQITVVADTTGENMQRDVSSRVSGSLEFNYTRERVPIVTCDGKRNGSGNNSSLFITIDTLPEMWIDDKYVVSGTTNLASGGDLCFEVSPPNLMPNYNFSFNPRDKSQGGIISGVAGCIPIVNGSGRENFWAFEMQTYSTAPGKYELNLSNQKTDPESFQVLPGIVSCSEEFIIHG